MWVAGTFRWLANTRQLLLLITLLTCSVRILIASASCSRYGQHKSTLWMDTYWVLQGKYLQFQGFFVEFLGLSTHFRSYLPLSRLVKSYFATSLQEAQIENPERFLYHDLFPIEGKAISSLINASLDAETIDAIEMPRLLGQDIAQPLVEDNICSDVSEDFIQKGVTPVYGNELARHLLSTSSSSDCCRACLHHPACVSWSYETDSSICRLQRHHHNAEALISNPFGVYGIVPLTIRKPQPRAIIFHGTTCAFQNRSYLAMPRDINTIVIGRYMLERNLFLSGLTQDEYSVAYCAGFMDEIWVPTEWHKAVLKNALKLLNSVSLPYIEVIPETVDTSIFDPRLLKRKTSTASIDLSGDIDTKSFIQSRSKECNIVHNRVDCHSPASSSFEFLSIFKWEHRKGWDILLEAYWSAFTVDDKVLLKIRTYLPTSDPYHLSILERMELLAVAKFNKTLSALPIVVIENGEHPDLRSEALSRSDIRELYGEADAFVLATRGEGWGLPIAEAMAMALPVIVSNAPGPIAFANDSIAYMIPVDEELDDLSFSKPSVNKLSSLLRQVIIESNSHTNYIAQRKGVLARKAIAEISADLILCKINERIRYHASRRGWIY